MIKYFSDMIIITCILDIVFIFEVNKNPIFTYYIYFGILTILILQCLIQQIMMRNMNGHVSQKKR